jgi:hypothetical protein
MRKSQLKYNLQYYMVFLLQNTVVRHQWITEEQYYHSDLLVFFEHDTCIYDPVNISI